MKNFLFLAFFLPLLAQSQSSGISIGANFSNFNSGVKHVDLVNTGIRVGFFKDIRFATVQYAKAKMSDGTPVFSYAKRSRWGLTTGIYYLHMGQRNEAEGYRNFSTYHIHLPIELKYRGLFLGGYVNRMVYARNNSFSGSTFGWGADKWAFYWHPWSYGLTSGGKWDMHGATLSIVGLYGLREGRTKAWTFEGDKGTKDRSVSVNLEIPFSTFKN